MLDVRFIGEETFAVDAKADLTVSFEELRPLPITETHSYLMCRRMLQRGSVIPWMVIPNQSDLKTHLR